VVGVPPVLARIARAEASGELEEIPSVCAVFGDFAGTVGCIGIVVTHGVACLCAVCLCYAPCMLGIFLSKKP
jgi:hypothetical protein